MIDIGFEPFRRKMLAANLPRVGGFVVDEQDESAQGDFDIPIFHTRTIMQTLSDRMRLARDVLTFAATLNP